MIYLDPIAHLLQTGLRVIPETPAYIMRLEKRLQSDKQPSHIRYITVMGAADWTPEPPQRYHLGITISWMCNTHEWMMASVEGHGGIHENDFFWAVPTFDTVVDLVLQYYFGRPQIVHGWKVPLHQHPELHYQDVERALVHATYSTSIAFQEVRRQFAAQVQEQYVEDDWQYALMGNFLQLSHADDPHRQCMLLRNGHHAYIIADETS